MDHSTLRTTPTRRSAAAGTLMGVTLAVAVGMISVGCAADEEPDAVFTAAHNATTAVLEVGDTFEVRLSENGSTGYSWAFTLSTEGVVEQVATDYVSESDRDGAGGTRVNTFECVASGEVRLDGYYFRSWEHEGLPEESDFTLNLVVQ